METSKLASNKIAVYWTAILGPGLAFLYLIDRFGEQTTYLFAISDNYILVSDLVVMTTMIILASRYLGKSNAKFTAVVVAMLQSGFGPMISGDYEALWPPAYLFSIILAAGLFYLYAGLINIFVKQKYSA